MITNQSQGGSLVRNDNSKEGTQTLEEVWINKKEIKQMSDQTEEEM